MIIEASNDGRRKAVQSLFESCFSDINPNAVPMVDADSLYQPIVLQYIDEGSGRLAGAALTCRSQVAVAHLTARELGILSGISPYQSVLDKHSELDLMCVAPGYRGRGIGTKLITELERRLRERAVRIWFGCVTSDLDVDRLREFYTRHNFKVLGDGQPLPPFLGKNWIPPNAEPPAFYFYKRL